MSDAPLPLLREPCTCMKSFVCTACRTWEKTQAYTRGNPPKNTLEIDDPMITLPPGVSKKAHCAALRRRKANMTRVLTRLARQVLYAKDTASRQVFQERFDTHAALLESVKHELEQVRLSLLYDRQRSHDAYSA